MTFGLGQNGAFGGIVGMMPARFLPGLPAGARIALAGDSIGARNVFGEWFDSVCTLFGLTRVGESEPLMPNKFESNIQGVAAQVNCTVAWDATRSYLGGTHSLKVTSVAAGTAYASFPGGVATTGGDVGSGLNLGMTANVPQTLGGSIWHPTATGGTGAQFTFSDKIGAGGYTTTASTAVTPSDTAWSTPAVIRTPPVGTTEMFARVLFAPTAAGQSIWVDTTYLVHTNGDVRPAIGGSALATASLNTNNLQSNIATRITAYAPDIIVLALGTNDFFAMTASYTPAQWETALRAVIPALQAIATTGLVIVCGIPPAKTQVPTTGLGPTGFATGQALRDNMDGRTRKVAREFNCPFVPLADMPLAYTDGIHPDANTLASVPAGGHTWMFQRFQDAMAGRFG